MEDLAKYALSLWTLAWTLIGIYAGFRMGRRTADRPLPPVVINKPKESRIVEQDPWHEPMTGEKQKSYPTVDEEE